jgi:hypothetical protein
MRSKTRSSKLPALPAAQNVVSPLSPDAPPGTTVILRLDDSTTWEVLKRDWRVARGEWKKGAAIPTLYVERA